MCLPLGRCPACSKPLPPTTQFCGHCGLPVVPGREVAAGSAHLGVPGGVYTPRHL